MFVRAGDAMTLVVHKRNSICIIFNGIDTRTLVPTSMYHGCIDKCIKLGTSGFTKNGAQTRVRNYPSSLLTALTYRFDVYFSINLQPSNIWFGPWRAHEQRSLLQRK